MSLKISKNTEEKLKSQLIDFMHILMSIGIALFVGGIFLVILRSDPFNAYWIIFSNSISNFDQVLRRATVYICTGLAVAIPIKSGAFNLGGEGQVAAGAMTAAMIGSAIALPMGIHLVACMLGAVLVGAGLAYISAFMKVKFGSSDVVTGIMLNYIVLYLLQYLSMYPFRGSVNSAQTARILQTATISRVYQGAQWSYGFFIAIALCIFFAFLINRTRLGLEMRSAGLSPLTAKYQGVNTKVISVLALVIGGGIAGIGGSLEIMGGKYQYLDTYFTNYGYDGIAVSFMANNNPLGIIITAVFVSMLKVGAVSLDRQTNISSNYVVALQGLIIIFLVSPYIVRVLIKKFNLRNRKAELAAS